VSSRVGFGRDGNLKTNPWSGSVRRDMRWYGPCRLLRRCRSCSAVVAEQSGHRPVGVHWACGIGDAARSYTARKFSLPDSIGWRHVWVCMLADTSPGNMKECCRSGNRQIADADAPLVSRRTPVYPFDWLSYRY
jgi:hypothetical protein